MNHRIADQLRTALTNLPTDVLSPDDHPAVIQVERTRDRAHGDFASNLAMTLARSARCKPRDLAEKIVAVIPASDWVHKVTIAGPGFINFHLTPAAWHHEIRTVLQQGSDYGRNNAGEGRKVGVEFVSANPTGPLHVGHGRGAAVGDSLCRLLAATGWDVTAEFYYNDAGQQINNLTRSVQARCQGLQPGDTQWPQDGYQGEYIADVARAYLAGETVTADDREVTALKNPDDTDAVRQFAVAWLRHEQDQDLQAFGVDFGVYFLESSLYDNGEVEKTVQALIDAGHTYEKEGALWLRTTDFGDDKDRVMRKSGGGYTYFLPDVAYHVNKWQRGFVRVINEQGADHHSTVTRVRAGLQALDTGIPKGWPEYVLHQMVTVLRGGEEVKLSKRAGSYVTLRDLIDEAGRDATRYFLVARKTDSQLTFDIDLARSQSNDNPVYYIQYAHARVCSVFRQLAERGWQWDKAAGEQHLALLTTDHEDALMVAVSRYPEQLTLAATNLDPHVMAHYLRELAHAFHTCYNAHQFLVEDAGLRNARLTLIAATRQVLANGLSLLGVSAPERM